MIISHFHLPFRVVSGDPLVSFEIYLTNLEAVDLRFRFRFLAPVIWPDPAMLARLRELTAPLREEVLSAPVLGHQDWTQSGGLFVTQWDDVVAAGATRREGLNATGSLFPFANKPQPPFGPVWARGHWELSLPALSAARSQPPRAQLAHDARVLISCFRQTWQLSAGRLVRDDKLPFLPASGRAEHLIPVEKTAAPPAATTPVAGAVTKRAGRKNAKRRR